MLAPCPHGLPVNTMDGGGSQVLNSVPAGCLDSSASTEGSGQSQHEATEPGGSVQGLNLHCLLCFMSFVCSIPLTRDPIYPGLQPHPGNPS